MMQRKLTTANLQAHNLETKHVLVNGELTIEDLPSYDEKTLEFLQKLENWLGAITSGKFLEINGAIGRLAYFEEQLKFVIEHKTELEQLSTQRRLIVLANCLGLIYGISLFFEKRYDSLIPDGWQKFSFLAHLLDYNYVRNEEITIEYPAHHKLVISLIEQYYLEDIPAIYETVCQINDIEQFKLDELYQPKSNCFGKNKESLEDLKKRYTDDAQFQIKLKELKLELSVPNIIRTCDIVDNLISLHEILNLIDRAVQYDLLIASAKEKRAFLGCFTLIGEYVKHLSVGLRQNTPYITWELYKKFRDILEHPDEAGRYNVIDNLLIDMTHASVSLLGLKKELIIFEKQIITIIDQYYKIPSKALLQDKAGKLFKSAPTSFRLPSTLKLSGKSKNDFYKLLNKDEVSYWQKIITGTKTLSDNDILFLNNTKQSNQDFTQTIETIFQLNKLLLENQKISQWSRRYAIDEKTLQEFLQLVDKLGQRDYWINVLNGLYIDIDEIKVQEVKSYIATLLEQLTLFNSVLDKIKPTALHSLILVFNKSTLPNISMQDIVSMTLYYLQKVADTLHDKLHDNNFMVHVFDKLSSFMIDNHKKAFQKLTREQIKTLKKIKKKQGNKEFCTLPETVQNEMCKTYIESGLYQYFENMRKPTDEQYKELHEDYAKQYNQHISELLLNDTVFCDDVQYCFTVIFALVKKMLEQKIVSPKVVKHLEHLKSVRNYLAHQDDYVSKILQIHESAHVGLLGEDTHSLIVCFEDLRQKLLIYRVIVDIFSEDNEERKSLFNFISSNPNIDIFKSPLGMVIKNIWYRMNIPQGTDSLDGENLKEKIFNYLVKHENLKDLTSKQTGNDWNTICEGYIEKSLIQSSEDPKANLRVLPTFFSKKKPELELKAKEPAFRINDISFPNKISQTLFRFFDGKSLRQIAPLVNIAWYSLSDKELNRRKEKECEYIKQLRVARKLYVKLSEEYKNDKNCTHLNELVTWNDELNWYESALTKSKEYPINQLKQFIETLAEQKSENTFLLN